MQEGRERCKIFPKGALVQLYNLETRVKKEPCSGESKVQPINIKKENLFNSPKLQLLLLQTQFLF